MTHGPLHRLGVDLTKEAIDAVMEVADVHSNGTRPASINTHVLVMESSDCDYTRGFGRLEKCEFKIFINAADSRRTISLAAEV